MNHTDQEYLNSLINYLEAEALNRQISIEITPETDILNAGVIDSLGLLNLIAFVEETFQVNIDAADVLLENFETPNALHDLIKSKHLS